MKWRNLLIWLIVLAVLGGFVYFYEFKGEAKREQAKEKAERLFDVKDQDVSSLTLERGGERTEIARRDGKWMITAPLSAPADQSAVSDMVRDLSTANSLRSISDAQNLSEYGLQPARLRLQFKTRQGASYALELGEKDYSESNVYAKIPSRPGVVLIPAFVFSSVDKTLFQLRDRELIEIPAEKVTQVEFESKGLHFLAQKSGTDWKLIRPIQTRGDSRGFSSFLGQVSNSEVAEFIDHPEADLKKYGLEPAIETLTITTEDGGKTSQRKLWLGSKTGDRVYARVEDRPALFQIAATAAEKMRPEIFKLRDKRIVAMELSDLQRVSIQTESATYEFERGKSKEAQWKVVQPKSLAGKDAREWKFWFPLEGLTANEILDPPQSLSKKGLFSSAPLRVTCVDQSNRSTEIRFSKPDKDNVWVRTSEFTFVFRVSNKKVEDWVSGLKDAAE
jgi:hypothetical protein